MTKNRMLGTFAAVFLFGGEACAEEWSVRPLHAPGSLGGGAVVEVWNVDAPEKTEITLVRFSEEAFELVVIGQGERSTAVALPELLRAANATAGCNGGYFEMPDFGVYGMQISNREVLGEIGKRGPLDGALIVRDGKPGIVRSMELSGSEGITQMVMCSPILVWDGALTFPKKGDDPYAPRTFVATDGEGQWLIGVSKRNTLGGLAELLRTHPEVTGFRVRYAMNLDGGPSSGLWCRPVDGRELHRKEGTKVKNVIAIVAKRPKMD